MLTLQILPSTAKFRNRKCSSPNEMKRFAYNLRLSKYENIFVRIFPYFLIPLCELNQTNYGIVLICFTLH